MEYQKAMKIAEKIRRKCGNCATCPISVEQNGVGVGCDTFLLRYPLQAEKVLEQWEKQHRKKTYKEDFFSAISRCAGGPAGVSLCVALCCVC